MAFVKLDTGMVDSSLWVERNQRSIFVTALLMAEPYELRESAAQFEVDSLEQTGWVIPPGWYGLVRAAGVGIVRCDGMGRDEGMVALAALGAPDPYSRSQEFEGRRLVRVDGGFLVLNFMRYRDKDHTNADRQRRFRERRKLAGQKELPHVNMSTHGRQSQPIAVSSKQKAKSSTEEVPSSSKSVDNSVGVDNCTCAPARQYVPSTGAVFWEHAADCGSRGKT